MRVLFGDKTGTALDFGTRGVRLARSLRRRRSPSDVIDDVLTCSEGTIEGLVAAGRLAIEDRRDLALRASDIRNV